MRVAAWHNTQVTGVLRLSHSRILGTVMTARVPFPAQADTSDPRSPARRASSAHCVARCTGGLKPQSLQRALAYMHAHLGERITLDQLAASAVISRFHFARQFRRATGYSPMAFVLLLRVEKAKLMLRQGGQSIASIAAALSFFDQSHFTRTFQRLVGMTPSQYGDPNGMQPTQPNRSGRSAVHVKSRPTRVSQQMRESHHASASNPTRVSTHDAVRPKSSC